MKPYDEQVAEYNAERPSPAGLAYQAQGERFTMHWTISEWIKREKLFAPAGFAAWLQAANVQADARPSTGLYQDVRIGHYCEQDGNILVTIY